MRMTWRALTAGVVFAVASALIVTPAASAAAAESAAPPAGQVADLAGAPEVATAAASDETDDTTDAAQDAGIDQPGDAYMGWSVPDAGDAVPNDAAPNGAAASNGAADQTIQAPSGETRAATKVPQAAGTRIDAPRSGLQALPPLKGVEGIDVSHHNWPLDWQYWWDQGRRFAYVKATEGTHYKDSHFAETYNGSYNVGMIRGAYHFATPNESSGAAQAEYFAAHGGAWSADGKTLPGVLDIESNPYGAKCYGLSQSQMRGWIKSFTERYKQRTGRNAVIYTSPSWWSTCTGNTAMFANTNPLWIAHWGTNSPRIPTGWPKYTFWQYTVHVYKIVNNKHYRIDIDRFGGNTSDLRNFALGKGEPISSPPTGVLDIAPGSLPIAKPGIKYSLALKGSGGVGKYKFRKTAGTLPKGLRLSSSGVISGTSNRAGTDSKFRIGASDDGGGTGSRTYRIYTTFTDMPKNQMFFRPVTWLARNNITHGYSNGKFRPSADVSRGAMAAFLYRSANPGKSEPKCTGNRPFRDIPTDYQFCGHIAWLAGQNITMPADGKYHAPNNVTRGSMTAFLYRLAHPGKASPTCTSKPFKDVSTSNVFCGYIQWAKDHGVAKGYGNGYYGPKNSVTRGAMAAFLLRLESLR